MSLKQLINTQAIGNVWLSKDQIINQGIVKVRVTDSFFPKGQRLGNKFDTIFLMVEYQTMYPAKQG